MLLLSFVVVGVGVWSFVVVDVVAVVVVADNSNFRCC